MVILQTSMYPFTKSRERGVCLFLGMLMIFPGQANSSTFSLDNSDPEAVLRIDGAEPINSREGVRIAERTYLYITFKLADNLFYEGYITRCADDYAANLNEAGKQQLSYCSEQVLGDLDHLMEKTPNLTLYFSGTQYIYRGSEGKRPYYYYSSANVANYYQTRNGRHPLYGLVYRCRQAVNDTGQLEETGATETTQTTAEVDHFIALAEKRCVDVLKVR